MIVDSLTFSPAGYGFNVRVDRTDSAHGVTCVASLVAGGVAIASGAAPTPGAAIDDLLQNLRALPAIVEAECATIARAAKAAWPEEVN